MACLGPWVGGPVALAVSGGADSLALAWLARRWQAEPVPDRPAALLGLIVDHGLRPESAAEAARTQRTLTGLGLTAEILTLRDLQPGPAIAARARAARYAALFAACRRHGIVDLLLGHHAADQAETVAIRLESGSGPRGLAGIAAIAEQRDLRLVRPLLDLPPAALRATLLAAGLDWVEDPSNSDPRHTRARLRAGLAIAPARAVALTARATRTAAARARDEAEAAAALAAHVSWSSIGAARVHLPPERLPGLALAALIRHVGAADWPPGAAALRDLVAGASRGATLGGTRLLPAPDGTWLMLREPAACAGPAPAGSGLIWDRRFRLDTPIPLPPGVTVRALGALRPAGIRRRWPALALRAGLPALVRDGELLAVPQLGWARPGYETLAFTPWRAEPLLRRALFLG